MEEPRTRLKFKKLMQSEGPLMPNGYRLATVEEINHNISTFKKWGLPIKTIKCSYDFFKHYRYRNIRLLDGWMTARFNDGDFQLRQAFSDECCWNAVVKEKEWDSNARKWKNKESALYSSNGISLRKQLYHGITLSTSQGIEAAWLQACLCNDVEVMYWLWENKYSVVPDRNSYDRLQRFKNSYHNPPFVIFMEKMRDVPTSEQLLLESATEEAQIILKNKLEELPSGPMYLVAITELFIEICGTYFVDTAFKCPDVQNIPIPIFTKLLSVLSVDQLEIQIPNIKPRFAEVLIEAIERGYERPLVEKLLRSRDGFELPGEVHYALPHADVFRLLVQMSTDNCVLALRGAVRTGNFQLLKILLDLLKMRPGLELPVEVDEEEKTLFHYALPHEDVFDSLVTAYNNDSIIRKQDKFGKNILHWAAYKGTYHPQVVDRLLQLSTVDLIHSRDDQGRTPLHIAASKGDGQMIEKLLSFPTLADRSQLKNYIQETDSSSRTALQMAAGEGHAELVRTLIEKGSDPLKERDVHRKTALHHAAQVKDPKVARATCQALLDKCGSPSLLLWASAAGIGTADQMEDVHLNVRTFLKSQKQNVKEHLLREAATNDNVEMAWELLNRGADMADILDDKWKGELISEKQQSVENVIDDINRVKKQGQDQPTLEDKLGRRVFAEGLAALFLNRFIESPITVGIDGEWGMGKSSLMIQTEKILLITAAQLAFPNLLPFDHFKGAKYISLNKKGRKIYEQIKRGVGNLLAGTKNKSKKENQNPLVNMLKEYQPQHHAVYKSLACMNNIQMLQSKPDTENSVSQQEEHALRGVPRILTVRYNAWRYSDQYEAWAGLGVTITEEIEKAMTRAQRFSTCCRYTWEKHSVKIWIQVILPCLLSIFLAGWVAWIVWMLLKQAKFKGLKYGSIPFTIIAIAWIVLKTVISVVKPVSTQMMGYITSPDHTNNLGYQEKVIADINFLKKELGKNPLRFFSFILGAWCSIWFGLFADNVENTSIPKFMPASEDQIRIITFVDDLDRCEEKVILQVLSAINVVLAECKINVIIGMDKKMIKRAIKRKFNDTDDEDLAEKFICKIIQIPLSLPDPTQKETHSFLEHRLGHKVPTEFAVEDTHIGSTYYEKENVSESQGSSAVPNIEPSNEVHITGCKGIVKKAMDCFGLSELRQQSTNATKEQNVDPGQHNVNIEPPSDEVQPGCKGRGIIKKATDWFGCEVRQPHKSDEENINELAFSEAVRLTREILLPNYSKEEADLIYKFSTNFATGYQKLPREWTRLLNYHKLAWNVLSLKGDVYSLPTWKVELVNWIFVSWQWKHEMNLVIKGWHKYTGDCQHKDPKRKPPRLSEIVANCASQLKKNTSQSLVSEGNNKTKRLEDFLKLQGPLEQDPCMKAFLCLYRDDDSISESDTSQNNWDKLHHALLEMGDVSMEGIQLFQQFRLLCETDHLPWPLPISPWLPDQ